MVMTDAQHLMAEGRKEGLREGQKKGQLQGRREALLELLEAKFGPPSKATRAAVKGLKEAQIRDLNRRILTAQSLAELGLPSDNISA